LTQWGRHSRPCPGRWP